jgi:hypothetical protein
MTNRRLGFSKTASPETRDEKITPKGAPGRSRRSDFQPPRLGLLLLNGHGDKNKQGSPNRIIRAALKGDATGDDDMRDIRNDLQERADLIHDRIKAAAVHFERMVEQLRNEHDARVADSKACLAMIAKLMEFEERHLANMSPEATPPPTSSQHADLTQKLRRVV